MQDIYKQRSNWKIVLAFAGLIILIITIIYSNFLANKLAANERKNATLFSTTINKVEKVNNPTQDLDIELFILENYSLPVILKREDGVYEGYNFEPEQNSDQQFLLGKVNEFLKEGGKPLAGTGYSLEVYAFNSALLGYIKYFPIVQMLLVGFFIGLGYYLFNTSKKAEQNRVWAGMAKETAHQLGTPISAIMGWIQHLRESPFTDPQKQEVVDELEKDVQRLDLVADRFSKIGSAPELSRKDIIVELDEVKEYMKRRAPRKINFSFPQPGSAHAEANINPHLFAWVIENLIRNSLDAMENEGEISAKVYQEDGFNIIDIKDTGKGIPTSKFKTIFQPGFSTKNRGWGLGLSLAKRIVEEYHKGKIFVKHSSPNDGTTFSIKIPIA